MAEPIIVRLINHQDLIVQWLPVKPTGVSEIQQGNLQALAKSIANRSVILLLPASEVLLLAIDLPVKSNNQIKKALREMSEEPEYGKKHCPLPLKNCWLTKWKPTI